jgi:hypothetical protein
MQRWLGLLGVVMLVACSGEAANRACDIYVENGGGDRPSVEDLTADYSTPEELKKMAETNARKKKSRESWKSVVRTQPPSLYDDVTPESRAKDVARLFDAQNAKAVAITAGRMGLSEREVLEYLRSCRRDPAKTLSDRMPRPKR